MNLYRVDIKTGYLCNNNCYFCVQAQNRHYGNRTTQEIKDALITAKKKGANGVVFTGGEFTIRKDAVELVAFAKELGFESIQLQTNGRMFANMDFAKRMVAAGANEFGPSLHGYKPEIHEYLTRAPGSWSQTVKGIINAKKLGLRVVVNSVVVKPNYRYTPQLAKLFVKLHVDQFQFAFVHALGNAAKYYEKMMPVMSLAMPYIKRGLKIGILNGIGVMVEAVPFCMLKGYERYAAELYMPDTMIKEPNFWIDNFEEVRKREGKKLFPQCKTCRFRFVCEGPWKEYPEKMGIEEFKPVPGEIIKSKQEILNNEKEFPIIPKD